MDNKMVLYFFNGYTRPLNSPFTKRELKTWYKNGVFRTRTRSKNTSLKYLK